MLLILNSVESRLQLVLARPEEDTWSLAASQEWNVPHTIRYAAPAVRQMLATLECTPASLTHIACVRGPGGFTGLRLSMSLAEGIAAGGGQLLAGLDYLPILANPALEVLGSTVCTVTHSRRKQVYFQAFAPDTHAPLCPPADIKLADLSSRLDTLPLENNGHGPVCLLGSGLRKNSEFFSRVCDDKGWRLLPDHWDTPRPEALLCAANRAQFGPGPLEPYYLRGSDAEENLESIAQKRGLDLTEARSLLKRGSRVE